MTTDSIISKVWSFCHTLRDDGVGYGDYLEQLTYLIFLKMADEYSRPPHSRKIGVPPRYAWTALRPLKGAELVAGDKTSLDLFWLKDDSLADLDNLPEPADLAEEIIENIEAGLENFRRVALSLAK